MTLTGRFVPGREYLWDNRTYQGRAGYEVLTPFTCNDGAQLLVDRGWIGTGDDRARLPRWNTPTAPLNLVGFVFVPAMGATWLQSTARGDWATNWPKRIGRLDIQRIAEDQSASSGQAAAATPAHQTYRYPVIVDGGGSGAFAYNFEPASISPTRNRGYVVQWFALAAGILGYLGYRSWQRLPAQR